MAGTTDDGSGSARRARLTPEQIAQARALATTAPALTVERKEAVRALLSAR